MESDGDQMAEVMYLLYDGQCPICHHYVTKLRLEQAAGKLMLINAREQNTLLDEVKAAGLDIDNGMVLKIGDQLYYGSDAIHRLALMGTRSGLFNRLNFLIFRSKILSMLLYPICKSFRDVLLWALRIPKINEAQ